MAASPRRVYWDACVWIALLMREKIALDGSDRDTVCRQIIAEARKNRLEILTSTLSLVEVCKSPALRSEKDDQLAAFFENDFILPINLDRAVGEHARMLMVSGLPGLKTQDAIHLASAVIGQASEFHTFDGDGSKPGLLRLDQRIDRLDGGKLRICTPNTGESNLPLLDQLKK